MRKTFVGPQLRHLRRQHGHTQAQMAKRLNISPAYVNLLENNQRSLSVQVLLTLTESYGVDLRNLVQDQETTRLADLRAATRDPAFTGPAPDLAELRGALDHAPGVAERFLQLYKNHRALLDQVKKLSDGEPERALLLTSPESAIHDFFRDNRNYFHRLDRAASDLRRRIGGSSDDMYTLLKRQLRIEHGIQTELCRISDMSDSLRVFDKDAARVRLSEALDHTNRIFQLAHTLAMVEARDIVDELLETCNIDSDAGQARLRIELNNYFAAALLMPYDDVLDLAETTQYDIDRIAAAYGVSFEQVCHRLTTLHRDGARGVPFFFLRVDRAGNVTKRFNATAFTLAEQGGSCPVWRIHDAFRTPGSILPQFVELPDGGQFFTFSRTSDRPVFSRRTQDRRVVVAMGCEREHAERIGYAQTFNMTERSLFSPIGINCQLCPRQACTQRAHQPLHMHLPLDANRRGSTRYES